MQGVLFFAEDTLKSLFEGVVDEGHLILVGRFFFGLRILCEPVHDFQVDVVQIDFFIDFLGGLQEYLQGGNVVLDGEGTEKNVEQKTLRNLVLVFKDGGENLVQNDFSIELERHSGHAGDLGEVICDDDSQVLPLGLPHDLVLNQVVNSDPKGVHFLEVFKENAEQFLLVLERIVLKLGLVEYLLEDLQEIKANEEPPARMLHPLAHFEDVVQVLNDISLALDGRHVSSANQEIQSRENGPRVLDCFIEIVLLFVEVNFSQEQLEGVELIEAQQEDGVVVFHINFLDAQRAQHFSGVSQGLLHISRFHGFFQLVAVDLDVYHRLLEGFIFEHYYFSLRLIIFIKTSS